MLGRALCVIVAVFVAACADGSTGRPGAATDREPDSLSAELAARTNELAEVRGELARLESTLSATRMERDARSASRARALSDQSDRAELLEDVADASRREFADALGTNDHLGALRACAHALDTALNEAAVSGPYLADVLHEAQRACGRAGVEAT